VNVFHISTESIRSVQCVLDRHISFGGVQVQTAFDSFLFLLTNIANGAILVMPTRRY